MFTGIIEISAELATLRPATEGSRLEVRPAPSPEPLATETGESIAINGVCLTLEAGSAPDRWRFFASPETLRRTTLGALRPGAALNLERALRAGDRLGGHFVAGHVDAVGEITRWERLGESWELEVAFPAELAPLLAVKGSVAVDGISLTVATLTAGRFTVAVIPHTVAVTNLRAAVVGQPVNLEADMFARYVVRALEAQQHQSSPPALSPELLARAGFA